MPRLPLASRDNVPENQRDLFDTLVGDGPVPNRGPGSVYSHVPELAQRLTSLNGYLRRESSLSDKILELAMLVTAREFDCQHIWNAHAASAREAGVPDELVDALREGEELIDLAPDEEAVVNYGQEFYRTHHVSRGAWQAAYEQFGKQGIIELTVVMGNYALLAFCINSFDTELPPDRDEKLLPV